MAALVPPTESVKSASVREPSVRGEQQPAEAASIKSNRSKASTKASTILETTQVAPLTSSNLSRLETASITSSGSRKPSGHAPRSPDSIASRSTGTVKYGPSLQSYNINDFSIPYSGRVVSPSTKTVPSNKELKRSNLMDRYAGMRDPFFDATYDLGAPDPAKKPKEKLEVAVVNPLIAARQARTEGDKSKLDKDAREALGLMHVGTPAEILAAAEKRAATKEVERRLREERERKEAEARRQREAEELARRRAEEAARKEQERLDREARKEQERLDKIARKEQERLDKEARRQQEAEAAAAAAAARQAAQAQALEPHIGDEVPTRVRSRDDGSHMVEELSITDALPPPVPGAGPAEDSQEGIAHAVAAGESPETAKEAAAEPLPSTDAGKHASNDQGTTTDPSHGSAVVPLPVAFAVPHTTHSVRVADAPTSPKDKEPGLFSKIFRRRSLKQAAEPTSPKAASRTAPAAKQEAKSEDKASGLPAGAALGGFGAGVAAAELPESISPPHDCHLSPKADHSELAEQDKPAATAQDDSKGFQKAEVLPLYRSESTRKPSNVLSFYQSASDEAPAHEPTSRAAAAESAKQDEAPSRGDSTCDAIDQAVASQDHPVHKHASEGAAKDVSSSNEPAQEQPTEDEHDSHLAPIALPSTSAAKPSAAQEEGGEASKSAEASADAPAEAVSDKPAEMALYLKQDGESESALPAASESEAAPKEQN